MEQKRFLKSFVSSVDVSKSEVTVNYTLPMPPLNMYQDTVGVLALGRSGRPSGSRTLDTLIKSKRHACLGSTITKSVIYCTKEGRQLF